ncbi:MAG: MBL fold metallo-hydrolase [Haloarculaceae archaeon]
MKQVQLGNHAFEGLNNCYVLGTEPDAETTLVDTGISTDETRAQLRDELGEYDVSFADVDRVLLTHHHGDHVGLAGEIQDASGASVHVHEGDAPLVSGDPGAEAAMRDRMEMLLSDWGMPDGPREELLSFLDASDVTGLDPEVTPFEDGDRFDIGSVALDVVHLPGHSVGLSGFRFEGVRGGELFSGDALLPYYTPNVGGADVRVESPLANYLETLTRIIEADYARAWPGHRGAIIDPSGRAADIVVHHRHRTGRIVDYLREEGPTDAWTVSAHLFGGLSSIHILHGPGEAYAHLGHLEEAGIVESSPGEPGSREYVLVDPDPDLDTLFPEVARGKAPPDIPGHE